MRNPWRPIRRRPTATVSAALFALLLAGGCGRAPDPRDGAVEPLVSDADFHDWDEIDWKFNRRSLASAYLFDRLRPDRAYEKYLRAIAFADGLRPLTVAEFRALPPHEQADRQRRARRETESAMALRRTLNRGWEIWTQTRDVSVSEAAMSDEMGVLVPAIAHLRRATALDPLDPCAWYDLGYFAGVVGDRRLQRQGLQGGLEALASLPEATGPERIRRDELELRLRLDLAWLDRDEGLGEEGMAEVGRAIERIGARRRATPDAAREAMLLKALLLVDADDVHGARALTSDWPKWRIPVQRAPFRNEAAAGPTIRKEGLEHIDSDFARNWVWILTCVKLGAREEALARMSERDYRTEFPPHLNHRFWQDMGYAMECLGERERSRLCYGLSILHHPYFPYFALDGVRGMARVLDQTGTGEPYFLGFEHFYVGGSFFSYAANRAMAMELAEDEAVRRREAEAALAALDACARRGIQTPRALALRGRVRYRLGDQEGAISDLVEADRLLLREELPRGETLKLLAVVHFNRRDYARARLWIDQYLSVRPDDDFGWCLAGLSMAHLGGMDYATNALEHARSINPGSTSSWYNLALVYLQRGRKQQAIDLLEDARRRFPDDPDIARLQQLVADQPDAPYRMVPGEAELKIASGDAVWPAWPAGPGDIDLTQGMDAAQAETLLPHLRVSYRQEPSVRNRVNLARVLMRADHAAEVQALLSPRWPDDLSREEALLLLNADRARQDAARATALVQRLRHQPNAYPDGEFWALVSVVCLENGARGAARLALARALELDPENAALGAMYSLLSEP